MKLVLPAIKHETISEPIHWNEVSLVEKACEVRKYIGHNQNPENKRSPVPPAPRKDDS